MRKPDKMSDSENGRAENGNQIGDVADDALSIFRVNIFIMAVYLSAMALSSQHTEDIGAVLESPFTLFGLILWFGTIGSSILSYRSARLISMADIDVSGDVLIQSSGQTIRDVAGTGLGTLGVVIALAIGVFDGIYVENLPAHIGLNILGIGLLLLTLFRFVFALVFKIIDLLDTLVKIIIRKVIDFLGIDSHFTSIHSHFITNLAILLYWKDEGQIPPQEVRDALRTIIEEGKLSEIEQISEEQLENRESK